MSANYHSMQTINSANYKTKIPIEQVKWENVPEFQDNSTLDYTLKFICTFGGPEKTLFEFGAWVGRSALGFTQNFKQVTSIDFVEGSDYQYSYNFANRLCVPGELALQAKNFSLIKENSLTFNFEPYYNSFDVVYVDGNHSEHGCSSDLRNAMLIGKKNSFIFIDDFRYVHRAVEKCTLSEKYYIEDLNLGLVINK